jgi:hypothetical protein
MKKISLIILLAVCAFLLPHSSLCQGAWQWSEREGTSVGNDVVGGVVVMPNGHIATAGSFSNPPNAQLYFDGPRQLVITVRDAAGTLQWQRLYGGLNAACYPSAIACDRQGNFYVLAEYFGQISFGAAWVFTCSNSTNVSQTLFDGLLIKLTPQGNVIWVKTITGFNRSGDVNIQTRALAIDASGNPWIGGAFRRDVNFDGYQLIALGGTGNGYVAKYDMNGSALGVFHVATQGTSIVEELHANVVGTVYAAGTAQGYVQFGAIVDTLLGENVFVAKLNSQVRPRWVRTTDNTNMTTRLSLTAFALKKDQGYVVAGQMTGAVQFGGISFTTPLANDEDIFTVSYDSAGQVQWAQPGSGVGWTVIQDVVLNDSGAVHLVGNYRNPLTIAGSTLPTAPDSSSGFLVRYSPQGVPLGTAYANSTRHNRLVAMASDGHQGIYVVGNFFGNVTIGNQTLINSGRHNNYYLSKYLNGHSVGTVVDQAEALKFEICPNPIISGQSITFWSDTAPIRKVALLDMAGHQVWGQSIELNNINIKISLPLLAAGIYSLEVTQADAGVKRKRIVIQ